MQYIPNQFFGLYSQSNGAINRYKGEGLLVRLYNIYTGAINQTLMKSYFAWPSCVYLIKNQMKNDLFIYKIFTRWPCKKR